MPLRISALAHHPLKSGAPVAVTSAVVEPWGLRGDRRWMIVDADGAMVTARSDPALLHVVALDIPDGLHVSCAAGSEDVPSPHDGQVVVTQVWGAAVRGRLADDRGLLTRLLGRPVRLLWCDDPTDRALDPRYAQLGDTVAFADGFPLLLTTTASLAALQEWVDAACADRGEDAPTLTMARFRPNVVVDGAAAWQEQEWAGVDIGGVHFRAPKHCGRCVMPNVDLDTLAVGKEPLRTIAARNRIDGRSVFGINLVPDGPGEIHVGDPVTPDPASAG